MNMIRIGGILLGLLLISSCAGTGKITTGPVTDTAYFDGKIELLAQELVSNSSKPLRRAAVLGFTNPDGRTSQLGKYLSTKFSIISTKNRLFIVPSAGQVLEAMKSEGINYRGSLDKEQAVKLGKALKVDGFVVGVLSDLQKGSDIDLMVKIIETKNGNMASAANISIHRSKSVSTLMQLF